MTPALILTLIVAWMVVACLACILACMASSRFSARSGQQEFDHEDLSPPIRRGRAARDPVGVRVEASAPTVSAKAR